MLGYCSIDGLVRIVKMLSLEVLVYEGIRMEGLWWGRESFKRQSQTMVKPDFLIG